jgi:hypothetical protein
LRDLDWRNGPMKISRLALQILIFAAIAEPTWSQDTLNRTVLPIPEPQPQAPGSRRSDIHGHALVLAEGHTAVHSSTGRWDVETTSGASRAVSPRCHF